MPVATAQVTLGAQLGVVGGTNLVRDSIVELLAIRPNTAVLLGVSAETPLDGTYRLGGALELSRSDLEARARSGNTVITRLTVWHPSLYLRRDVTRGLRAEARLGAIIYQPADREGTLFRDGAPIEPTVGIGLLAERVVGGRLAAGLAIHYDVHRFSTTTLRSQGFDGETFVHRVAATLSLRLLSGAVASLRP